MTTFTPDQLEILDRSSVAEVERYLRQRKEKQYINVAVPPELNIGDTNYDPSSPARQYEVKTMASYEDYKGHKTTREFYDKHQRADVIVVNQSGVPLYALYMGLPSFHYEETLHFFKTLRGMRLWEWEDDDER